METEDTLTLGPPQTKKKTFLLSGTILRLRRRNGHERYSYLELYYAFETFKDFPQKDFFFPFCISIPSLGKNLFQSHAYIILP